MYITCTIFIGTTFPQAYLEWRRADAIQEALLPMRKAENGHIRQSRSTMMENDDE